MATGVALRESESGDARGRQRKAASRSGMGLRTSRMKGPHTKLTVVAREPLDRLGEDRFEVWSSEVSRGGGDQAGVLVRQKV